MKKKGIILISLLLFACQISCTQSRLRFISFDHKDIKTTGRTAYKDSLLEMYWSGTSIKFNFEGTSVSAIFKDQNGDNYYNIIVDGQLHQVLKLDSIKKNYVLAHNLQKGIHKVEIFKRTEWNRGITRFYGLELPENTKLLPRDQDAVYKIEFFGNSITAGYAIEDTEGKDRHEGSFTNHYNTYAALTARHFNADHHCTCKSGIGVMISWFPLTMPQMYDRLNPEDTTSKWDFSRFTPDLVIINLLQNDSWLVNKPEYETFKTTFGSTPPTEEFIVESYRTFVSSVREKYPNAQIICMLGTMDITKPGSKWPGYVETALHKLNDPKTHTLFIPYKGTHIHPLAEDNKTMAEVLIAYINSKKLLKK